MSETNSTTNWIGVPLTEERLNELVQLIAFRYDDPEQAAALIELLYGVLNEKTDGARQDLINQAIQRAFTFTPEFKHAVNAYLGEAHTDDLSSKKVDGSDSGQESEKVN